MTLLVKKLFVARSIWIDLRDFDLPSTKEFWAMVVHVGLY